MTKIRRTYGVYYVHQTRRQRVRDWLVDRLARPYRRVALWIDDHRPIPDTIEEMQRRGVYDAEKLGM